MTKLLPRQAMAAMAMVTTAPLAPVLVVQKQQQTAKLAPVARTVPVVAKGQAIVVAAMALQWIVLMPPLA